MCMDKKMHLVLTKNRNKKSISDYPQHDTNVYIPIRVIFYGYDSAIQVVFI